MEGCLCSLIYGRSRDSMKILHFFLLSVPRTPVTLHYIIMFLFPVLGLIERQMAEAREPESGGFDSRGSQPSGGDPSGADPSLPEPTHTPCPARRPTQSKPELSSPGRHPFNPKDSLRVCRPTENSTQPEREKETGQKQVKTQYYGPKPY